jgi:SCP-2 sterol transfer family
LAVPLVEHNLAMATAPPGADPISFFFDGLAAPGHVATFERESATVRFDVDEPHIDRDEHGRSRRRQARRGETGSGQGGPGEPEPGLTEHWYLTISNGDVTVTGQDEPADTVVHIARPDLEAMVTGRLNAQAALLRGLITCEGSMAALMVFQRSLPGPPGSTGRVPPISSQDVMLEHSQTPASSSSGHSASGQAASGHSASGHSASGHSASGHSASGISASRRRA